MRNAILCAGIGLVILFLSLMSGDVTMAISVPIELGMSMKKMNYKAEVTGDGISNYDLQHPWAEIVVVGHICQR